MSVAQLCCCFLMRNNVIGEMLLITAAVVKAPRVSSARSPRIIAAECSHPPHIQIRKICGQHGRVVPLVQDGERLRRRLEYGCKQAPGDVRRHRTNGREKCCGRPRLVSPRLLGVSSGHVERMPERV